MEYRRYAYARQADSAESVREAGVKPGEGASTSSPNIHNRPAKI